MIAGLRDLGKTVFLTTHYMDEAQAIADRAAIIVAGRIVAEGTPSDLGGRAEAPSRIRCELNGAELPDLPGARVEREGGSLTIQTANPVADLNRLTGWALENRVELANLEVERPSLEDIYLSLTATDVR